VKFLPNFTPEDDNIYYEVALAKWLVQIDKNMMGKLLWPDNDSVAGKLVRIEAKADKTWRQLEVEVKRYYAKKYLVCLSYIKNTLIFEYIIYNLIYKTFCFNF